RAVILKAVKKGSDSGAVVLRRLLIWRNSESLAGYSGYSAACSQNVPVGQPVRQVPVAPSPMTLLPVPVVTGAGSRGRAGAAGVPVG
ncbi:MAG TPA: hypothetical protein VMY42_10440, partial [Thermoguttaceae bacterium]|nr:hypothetical protein [Thermoguttaceae bacterium]